MTVEQRADDAAIQHAREGLMMDLCYPLGNYFVTIRKTSYMKSLWIGRPAAKTCPVRRIRFLKRFFCIHKIPRLSQLSHRFFLAILGKEQRCSDGYSDRSENERE